MNKPKALDELEQFIREAPPADVLELIGQLVEQQPEIATRLLALLRARQEKNG